MLEDGTAPQETATIERVCGGSARAEGYTDSKGYFFIELGNRNNGILQDASEVGGYGDINSSGPGRRFRRRLPWNGVLRDAIRQLRTASPAGGISFAGGEPRQSARFGQPRHRDHSSAPDGAQRRQHGQRERPRNPKDARKAFDKGQEASKKSKPEEALKNYSKAVELYQQYAAAWYELGKLQAVGGDLQIARGSFNEAVKADPKFLPALVAIADIDVQAKKWREVVDVTDRAAKLDAFDYPQVFFYNAVANFNLKNLEAAEKSVKQAERLDTRHRYPQIYFLLGLLNAVHQDYAVAAEKFRIYLNLAPNAEDAPTARKQLAQVEALSASAQVQKQDQ